MDIVNPFVLLSQYIGDTAAIVLWLTLFSLGIVFLMTDDLEIAISYLRGRRS